MSDVERFVGLTDEQLLDLVGPPGSEARNAALALALKSMQEGARNSREAAEHSGRYRRPSGTSS